MDLDSFTANSEEILCSNSVRRKGRNGLDEYQKGQLACTEQRVLFITDDSAINITPNSITSIEYTPSNWFNNYMLATVGILAFLVVSWTFFDLVPGTIPVPREVIAIILGAIGLGTLLQGLFLKDGELRILTQNKTYEFQTSDNRFAKRMCAAVHSVQR